MRPEAPRPLVSKGHFRLSKSKGLLWVQTEPFTSILKVDKDEISQSIEGGVPTIITKEEQLMVFSFSNLFMSVFKGNTKAIEHYFTLTFSGNVQGWMIRLKPESSPLNKAIDAIEMTGSTHIKTITIYESGGNYMNIELSDIQTKSSR
ncbi:MAG: LolA family protein [Francisellaceae bacterium]